MREREQQPSNSPLPFPFPLPERFLDQLGYRGPYPLVGLYWGAGDELAVYDPEIHSVGGYNHYPYLELMRQPKVWHWLDEYLVHLGSSDRLETHHLVVDDQTNKAYILERARARRAVRSQRLDLTDNVADEGQAP